MFICDKDKKSAYITSMEQLKAENRARREKHQELILRNWNQQIQTQAFLSALRDHVTKRNHRKNISTRYPRHAQPPANYFSDHRIAVYTCILGGYDRLVDPKITPDNIDYYVITDQSVCNPFPWTVLKTSHLQNTLSHLSNAEQNRWYKMHPHLLFPEYDYSIYLDGNITPVSDLTEFINYLGPFGIATHHHYARECVYAEAQAILQRGKDIPENVHAHINFLKEQSMLEGYGLADCSVIVRKHHHALCVSLMEEWWHCFLAHSRRDQLSFPYVLFKNKIPLADVATLGSNRMFNDALNISTHARSHA